MLFFAVAFRILATVLLLVVLTTCKILGFLTPFGGYPIIKLCQGGPGYGASISANVCDGVGAGASAGSSAGAGISSSIGNGIDASSGVGDGVRAVASVGDGSGDVVGTAGGVVISATILLVSPFFFFLAVCLLA